MGTLDGHDVTHLADTEQCCHARHQVLAEGGRWAEYVRVVGSDLRYLRREYRGEAFRIGGTIDSEHIGDAGNGRSLARNGRRVGRQHQYVDGRVGDFRGATHALQRAGIELRTVMFCNDKDLAHYTNPFFLSASTSSATSFTIVPFWRCGGASTFTVVNAEAPSAPKSARPSVSSGFFFAFMMSGNFT